MNKLALLSVLFGLVAIASASPVNLEDPDQFSEYSELRLAPTDDSEVAGLAPDQAIFSDYCLRSRDLIFTNIKDKKRSIIPVVSAVFFGNVAEVTKKFDRIQIEKAQQAMQEIAESQLPSSEKSAGNAMANYAKSLASSTADELLARLSLLKKSFSSERLRDVVGTVCQEIRNDVQKSLTDLFDRTKDEILQSDPSEEIKTMVDQATFDNVNCLTTGRAKKAIYICGLIQKAGSFVYTMMGI